MKIYAISGLGADERVFSYLDLDAEIIPVKWIEPKEEENLASYALRLIADHPISEEDAIMGVSFGGMLLVEIAKKVKCKYYFSISSIELASELPRVYQNLQKAGIPKMVPSSFYKIPAFFAPILFGAEHKQLVKDIVRDTDMNFVHWAVTAILGWDNIERIDGLIKISADKDLVLPPKSDDYILIKNSGHHMIIDRAEELSSILNKFIQTPIEVFKSNN